MKMLIRQIFVAVARAKIALDRVVRRLVYEYRGKAPMPSTIIVDPINSCNLRCPLCPTGLGKLADKRSLLRLEELEDILNQIPTLREIGLFNWGEPLLHPDIVGLIRTCKNRGLYVYLHTNMNVKKDARFFENLVVSQIDKIIVSLDGASQETANRYRKGVNFDLVFTNLMGLANEKRRLKKKRPILVWKFLVNKHNEHEIGMAQKMARDIGVRFQRVTMHLGEYSPDLEMESSLSERREEWLPSDPRNIKRHYRGAAFEAAVHPEPCYHLFQEPVISPNGALYPCCHVTNQQNAIGNVFEKPFVELWNGSSYAAARALFTSRTPGEGVEVPSRTICSSCKLYQKRK